MLGLYKIAILDFEGHIQVFDSNSTVTVQIMDNNITITE
jgi:hypothetical protein